MVMYKATAAHFSNTMGLMNKLRQEHSFCDVILTVGHDHIHAHKCVLAAGSPYFQTLFLGRFTEASKNDIDLSEVTDDTAAMELIVDFIYTGQIDINSSNLKVLVKLSSFFLVETLQRFCIEFMQTTLNLKTCLCYYLYASDHGLSETLEMTEAIVKTRFHDCMIFNEESLEVSPDEMSYLLDKDIFKFCSCNNLLQYAVKWVVKGMTDRHLLIGCDLLDMVLHLKSQTVHKLPSMHNNWDLLKSKLESANIEGKDDFLNKYELVFSTFRHSSCIETEKTVCQKSNVGETSGVKGAASTVQSVSQVTTGQVKELQPISINETENVVITLSPRKAVYEQTYSVAQYDFYDFVDLQDKPIFDLCAYVPAMRQWFYIRNFDLDDTTTQLFEPWTDWGFDLLGQELLMMKLSGDDDLNFYSLQENQWRMLNYSDQIDGMVPLNEFSNDLCFVADVENNMYLICRVRVFHDENDGEPFEIYFKGFSFEQSSSSWVHVFDSERIDVSEISSSGSMDMRAKVSSSSREMFVMYSTDDLCVALVIDLKQSIKHPVTLLSDFGDLAVFVGIKIVETADRFLLVTDGTAQSNGTIQVKYEYIFHSGKLTSVSDNIAHMVGEFKMTPNLAKRHIFPCLQQTCVDHGSSLWYIEGNMSNVSSLCQITFDETRSSSILHHIPPPFTSITGMFVGKIRTNIMSRLKPIQKCF